jgi:hypothetical protein
MAPTAFSLLCASLLACAAAVSRERGQQTLHAGAADGAEAGAAAAAGALQLSAAAAAVSGTPINCDATDAAGLRSMASYVANCQARAWHATIATVFPSASMRALVTEWPTPGGVVSQLPAAAALVAAAALAAHGVTVPAGWASIVQRWGPDVAGVASAVTGDAVDEMVLGEDTLTGMLTGALLGLRYMQVRSALLSVQESPLLVTETQHGALLSAIVAKLPADTSVLTAAAVAIDEAAWTKSRKWTRFFVSVGVDVGATLGSSGGVGFFNIASKLAGLGTVGELAADALISDPKTSKAFALICWFQSLVEEIKTAVAPIFAARSDKCLIDFQPGTVVGNAAGASSAAAGTWESMFYWRVPGALRSRKVLKNVLDELMSKAKLAPNGCEPLRELAENLDHASYDNRVLWRVSYARFAEHRVGQRFALKALTTIAADMPAFHDSTISEAVLKAGAVEGAEGYPKWAIDEMSKEVTM